MEETYYKLSTIKLKQLFDSPIFLSTSFDDPQIGGVLHAPELINIIVSQIFKNILKKLNIIIINTGMTELFRGH